MYITCQECDTIFRLDESRLKPTGSKVRCSQCGNTFIARPLETVAVAETGAAAASEWDTALNKPSHSIAESREPATKAYADQELEGIDLAELDSILDQGIPDQTEEEADLEVDFSDVPQSEELAELDDDDLDLDFDMDLEPEEEPVAEAKETAETDELEDIDLDMPFDLEDDEGLDAAIIEPDRETAAAPKEKDAGEERVFDEEDLSLETDEEPLSAEAHAPVSAIQDEDLEPSLDDLDLDLDLEESGPQAAAQTEEPKDEELELDMEFGLEDQEEESAPPPEEQELELDDTPDQTDELSLEMEAEAETPETSATAEVSDDLDLSDLDNMLGSFDEEQPADVELEEGPEVELSLDSTEEENDISASVADASADEEELEELEFELDAEFEDKPIAQEQTEEAAEAEEDEEIDLSDIEQMLEGDGSPAESAGQGDLNLEMEDSGNLVDSGEDIALGGADEIDLTEIEEAIDQADAGKETPEEETDEPELDLDLNLAKEEAPAEGEDLALDLEMEGGGASEDEQDLALDLDLEEKEPSAEKADLDLELDLEEDAATKESEDLALDLEMESETADAGDEEFALDLELESEQSQAQKQDAASDDDEFDLSEFGDLIEEEKAEGVKSETIDTGDIELEFQVEEEEAPEPAHARVETETMTTDFSIDETIPSEPEIQKPVARPRPVKKKQGTSKGLIFVLLLLLLGGAGYFGYDYMVKSGIEIPRIPYISDYLNPKPKDPKGIMALSTLEINGKFIENEQAGRLFVITGKVRNGYSTMRGMIRLQGKLFSAGKKLAKSEFVYAGLSLSDQELGSLPIAQIKAQLSAVPKPQDPGAKVRPNQAIAFMVVFNDLPDDLDEYAIELVSSVPIK